MLYALGPVVFDVFPLNAEKVEIETEHPHAEHPVLGAPPIYEGMGMGRRPITLEGKVFPSHFGGLADVAALDAACKAGMPQHMMRGDGTPIGWVLIQKLRQRHGELDHHGVGREIDVTVDLKVCDAPFAGAFIDFIGGLR